MLQYLLASFNSRNIHYSESFREDFFVEIVTVPQWSWIIGLYLGIDSNRCIILHYVHTSLYPSFCRVQSSIHQNFNCKWAFTWTMLGFSRMSNIWPYVCILAWLCSNTLVHKQSQSIVGESKYNPFLLGLFLPSRPDSWISIVRVEHFWIHDIHQPSILSLLSY